MHGEIKSPPANWRAEGINRLEAENASNRDTTSSTVAAGERRIGASWIAESTE